MGVTNCGTTLSSGTASGLTIRTLSMTDNAIQNIQSTAKTKIGSAVKETGSYRRNSTSIGTLHAYLLIHGRRLQDHQDSIQMTLFSRATGRMRLAFSGTLPLAGKMRSVS